MNIPYNDNAEQALEEQFQKDDAIVHRYLELVAEIGKIPGSEITIIRQLESEFDPKIIASLFSCNDDDGDEDEQAFKDEMDEWMQDLNDMPESEKRDFTDLNSASDMAASTLVSALIEWTNLFGLDCPPAQRLESLKCLYLLSKALSFLLQSFDCQHEADIIKAIVFIKRSLTAATWSRQIIFQMPSTQNNLLTRNHMLEKMDVILNNLSKIIELSHKNNADNDNF